MDALALEPVWPCQRWKNGRHTWQSGREALDPSRYDVDVVDDGAAKAFVLAHHYSRSYPASRLRFGLFDRTRDDQLVGTAVLSVPVQAKVLTGPFPHLEPYAESLELGRFVLLDEVPANAESWFLARAFRLAADVGVRGVVSFADPLPRRISTGTGTSEIVAGHVGTIYQASNAIKAGSSRPRRLTLLPDGRVLNARALSKLRRGETGSRYVERLLVDAGARPLQANADPATWLATAIADAGGTSVQHPGNHRYLFALGGRRSRQRLLSHLGGGDPYPKQPEPCVDLRCGSTATGGSDDME